MQPPAGFDSVVGEPGGDLAYDEAIGTSLESFSQTNWRTLLLSYSLSGNWPQLKAPSRLLTDWPTGGRHSPFVSDHLLCVIFRTLCPSSILILLKLCPVGHMPRARMCGHGMTLTRRSNRRVSSSVSVRALTRSASAHASRTKLHHVASPPIGKKCWCISTLPMSGGMTITSTSRTLRNNQLFTHTVRAIRHDPCQY